MWLHTDILAGAMEAFLAGAKQRECAWPDQRLRQSWREGAAVNP